MLETKQGDETTVELRLEPTSEQFYQRTLRSNAKTVEAPEQTIKLKLNQIKESLYRLEQETEQREQAKAESLRLSSDRGIERIRKSDRKDDLQFGSEDRRERPSGFFF